MDVEELTVPDAARRVGRNPETIRRWIREGKIAYRRFGTQYLLRDEDLRRIAVVESAMLPLPPEWSLPWGNPNTVGAIERLRAER